MEPKVQRPRLSFSIDSILSHTTPLQPRLESPYKNARCTSEPGFESPYKSVHCAGKTVFDSKDVCYGTEALEDRLREYHGDDDHTDAEGDDLSRSHHSDNDHSPSKHSDSLPIHLLKMKPKKKTRTVFSRQQVFYLEAAFDAKRYLSSAERSEIATSLNLSETQVKVWFQNRRNKWKAQLNGDGKGAPGEEAPPVFLPPFLCGTIAAAAQAQVQRAQTGGLQQLTPFYRTSMFY